MMKISEKGLELCRFLEGFEATAKDDGFGTLTVGYGHTNKANQAPRVVVGLHLSEAQARQVLADDLTLHEGRVGRLVTYPLTQAMFDACVLLDFNAAGMTQTDGVTPSTLVNKLNAGDLQGAAAEFPKWCHCNGRVIDGLVRRGHALAALFLSDPSPLPAPKSVSVVPAPSADAKDLAVTSRKFALLEKLKQTMAAVVATVTGIFSTEGVRTDPGSALAYVQQGLDLIREHGLTAALVGSVALYVALHLPGLWMQQDIANGTYTPSGAPGASGTVTGATA